MKIKTFFNSSTVSALLVSTCLLASPLTIQAQSALGLSAIPPRLEIEVQPGEVQTATIKVRNESASQRFITTNISDFVVTDDSGTPIQIELTDINPDDNRWAAAGWVQVSPSKLKLGPGETKSLVLTIIAPQDAIPGGHYAMVLHTPDISASIDGTGSSIQTNVGTLVYVTIPGNIKQDAIVKEFTAPKFLEFGPVSFKTTVTNLSDVHISPIGNITIKNWFGNVTADLPLDKTNIFPYVSRDFANTLQQKWLFGRYQAQLNAGYGTAGGALLATLYFWVIPWRLIILVIAAVTLTLILITLLKKQRNNQSKPESNSPDLETLKNKYKDRK